MVAVLRVLRQEHADLARLLEVVEAQLGGDGAPDFALLTGITLCISPSWGPAPPCRSTCGS